MIKRSGSKFKVVSHSGRALSKPMSKSQAKRRLAQVEYFKHADKEDMQRGYKRSY